MAYTPQPVRRTYIPKPGTDKQRPLGIPAYEDKLVQAALVAILEPIYEADFIEDSYGFRPHRGCHYALRHDDEVVYIERTSGNSSMMRVVQIIGARAPLHITAVGKLFLAEDGPDKCGEYARRTGLPKYTENTLTDAESLVRELDRIRRQGFAFDNEEAEKGVSCIGAGIFNDEGRLVAGLSVSAPSDRLNRGWAAHVRQTAEKISRAIGHSAQ